MKASYKNTVDSWMRWTIAEVKRFALIDITPQENQLVLATEGSGGK
jgi:hypothetical protein